MDSLICDLLQRNAFDCLFGFCCALLCFKEIKGDIRVIFPHDNIQATYVSD